MLPGAFLAMAIRSSTELMPDTGFEAITRGDDVILVTGCKSLAL